MQDSNPAMSPYESVNATQTAGLGTNLEGNFKLKINKSSTT
jgi:hypothetical protein